MCSDFLIDANRIGSRGDSEIHPQNLLVLCHNLLRSTEECLISGCVSAGLATENKAVKLTTTLLILN